MKKEEEKSYAGLYLILSFILVLTSIGAIWNEAIGKRPWKHYQSRFYELEYEKAQKDYEKAVQAFEQPDVQKNYKDVQEKLNEARDAFMAPVIQKEYKKTLKELRTLDAAEISPLKFEAVAARNQMLEEEYLYGKYKTEESKKKIEVLEEKSKELTAKIKLLEEKRAGLQNRVDGYEGKITSYTEQLNGYTEEKDSSRKIMEKLKKKRPGLQVYQVHLEEINEADRCMSCHVGINRKESVSEEQPYASHPMMEVYLRNHPPEKFGCVLCHEGQARATTSVEKAHGEVEYWLWPMYKGKVAQSSCIKCHDKRMDMVGGEEIWKGLRLFEELRCYGCHEVKGFGKDKYASIAPDLTEISSKVNATWLVEWLMGTRDFRPTTRMPDFILEEKDAKAIAAYLWQHSEGLTPGEREEFDEDTIDEGAYIFESVGCLACHSDVEEDGERTHGPNLARIGEKVRYEYLVSWLLDPKKHQPGTRMPNFRLDEESAMFLAAYLTTLKSEGYEERSEEPEWLDVQEVAGLGEKLISRYGCFGCHKIEGMEDKSKIGVELTEVGSKDLHLFDFGLLEKEILGGVGLMHASENIGEARHAWINAKLSDPRQFDKGRYKRPEDRLRMPNFGLKKDEVEALSIFLLGLREGRLPENYVSRLTEEKKYLAEGKRIVDKYNCMGCHQFSIDTLYLEDGTEAKGMVKLEEEDSLFFQLWEDNEKLGRKAGETAQIMKDQIKDRIKAEGGDIASFIIDYHVEEEGRVPEEARVFTPPVLYGEGKKVQCTWAFDFLEEPIGLRPWLDIRMPTYKLPEHEATALSRYFAVIEGEEYPYEYIKETKAKYIEEKERGMPGYLAMARHLIESKDVNCASCHVRGDITPKGEPADWAPDLSLSRKRLKPDWIVRWLLDPQLIQPGTKMPKFFREGVFQDIFPGTPEEQAEALKDLLMNLPEEMLKEQGTETDE